MSDVVVPSPRRFLSFAAFASTWWTTCPERCVRCRGGLTCRLYPAYVSPPLTLMVWPVMYDAPADAKNATA